MSELKAGIKGSSICRTTLNVLERMGSQFSTKGLDRISSISSFENSELLNPSKDPDLTFF